MVAAIRVPKSMRAKRELLKHAPKLVESGGETSSDFFSLKSDCSLLVGRTYDHHIYDLFEVGVENYKSIESYAYDNKSEPKLGTKPFFAFIGEHFESVEELKHLKEMLLVHFKGEVVENLNLVGVDRIFVCTALSPTTVYMMHCALRLKRSGTSIPRMDLVVRWHRFPAQDLQKEAMKAPGHAKKTKNVSDTVIDGKQGMIYIPDQEFAKLALTSDLKGLKRERREHSTRRSRGSILSE